MEAIGFKNFRRFENLEPLQLSGVNFFVGGNNSGKSTVTKGMMLLMDNLEDLRPMNIGSRFASSVPSFRFDANHIHNVHVGTFGRALHKPYPEVKEMIFETVLNGYKFVFTITGDVDSTSPDATIKQIEILNIANNVLYTFDFDSAEFRVKYNTYTLNKYSIVKEPDFYEKLHRITPYFMDKTENTQELIQGIGRRLTNLKRELDSEKNPVEIARLNNRINMYSKQLNNLLGSEKTFFKKIEDKEYKAPLMSDLGYNSSRYITALLDSQWRHYMDIRENCDLDSNYIEKDETQFEYSFNRRMVIEKFYNNLPLEEKALLFMFAYDAKQLRHMDRKQIEYLSAHTASQKVLFSIEDKNDYMTQVIRDYMAERIIGGSELHQFVCDWLFKHFEIALDFEIRPIEGEAYTIEVTTLGGEKMPLADLGMGAVQLILLLLRIATIISRAGNIAVKDTTFIIEEPEQNIHPKLQSKLADLFAYVNQKYGCQFIIETHSEYMIRRTQAMIATGKDITGNEITFENNPFRVYYFPEKGHPYDMEYQESGRFVQSFGHGFFDESAKHTTVIANKEHKETISFDW